MSKKRTPSTIIERFGFRDPDLSSSEHDNIINWIDDNALAISLSVLSDAGYPVEIRDGWDLGIVDQHINEASEYVKNRIASLEDRIQQLGQQLYGEYKPNNDDKISQMQTIIDRFKAWQGLGEPPEYSPLIVQHKRWESTVTTDSGKSVYTVGFIDLEVETYTPILRTTVPRGKSDEDVYPPSWAIGRGSRYTICFEAKTVLPTLGELLRQINLYKQYKRGIYVVVSHDERYCEKLREQHVGYIKYPVASSRTAAQEQGKLI